MDSNAPTRVRSLSLRNQVWSDVPAWLALLAGVGILPLAWWLRDLPASRNFLFYGQLELADGLLAFGFATAVLARFRETHDRRSLALASAFALNGISLVSLSLAFPPTTLSADSALLRDPFTWVFNRTLLGFLFVTPLLLGGSRRVSRHPNRELGFALASVIMAASLLSAIHWQLALDLLVRPGTLFPRPTDLLPAALFAAAMLGYSQRPDEGRSLFENALATAAALNLMSCLAASQSERILDVPFTIASLLQFASYGLLLVGVLFDNVRLFDRVRELAASDPLTHLANYRRMMEALESERRRSNRTGSPFAIVLFDLDGLKEINDRHGHAVGSRAICRVALALRQNSRVIDLSARYGGDEFALVLPETDAPAALEVADRVCRHVSQDEENPRLSLSMGIALYPRDGHTIEVLFAAADRELYQAKEKVWKEARDRATRTSDRVSPSPSRETRGPAGRRERLHAEL